MERPRFPGGCRRDHPRPGLRTSQVRPRRRPRGRENQKSLRIDEGKETKQLTRTNSRQVAYKLQLGPNLNQHRTPVFPPRRWFARFPRGLPGHVADSRPRLSGGQVVSGGSQRSRTPRERARHDANDQGRNLHPPRSPVGAAYGPRRKLRVSSAIAPRVR